MGKLKVKFLKLSAGRPVAILHKNFAQKSSINVNDRIYIEKKEKKIVAVVDTASGLLKENEIVVSTEVITAMKLKEGDSVNIELALKPESIDLIYDKLNNKTLDKEDIKQIISDIVKNRLTEAELAYFIAGIYKCGMNFREIRDMTKAILDTGKKLKLKGKVADKHSIGGIPGRTTPIIISICSSLGLLMPKTSSRAITTPAGTADAMEVLCKVDFSIPELKKIIKKTNACIVWGGSLGLAPADDKIIRVERLLNLDPEAQLLSSILAKKLAVNAKYVLINIPYGENAKVTKKQAKELGKKFKRLGNSFDMKINCFLNKTEEPIGNGIGPALEIQDVVKVLKRESPCYKLEKRALELSGKLLELTGKAKTGTGIIKAKKALDSGQALKKFKEILKAQKGELDGKKKTKFNYEIKSEKTGKIKEIKTKEINSVARVAGCPYNKYAGIYLYKHVGSKVKKGEKLLTIYAETKPELREAVNYYKKFKPIKLK